MILMRTNPFRGPLKWVGPENRRLFWAQMTFAHGLVPFQGPPLPKALEMDLPASIHYVPRHIDNSYSTYISSKFLVVTFVRYVAAAWLLWTWHTVVVQKLGRNWFAKKHINPTSSTIFREISCRKTNCFLCLGKNGPKYVFLSRYFALFFLLDNLSLWGTNLSGTTEGLCTVKNRQWNFEVYAFCRNVLVV